MYKPALVGAIISGLLAVALGAFGAHGLQQAVTPEVLSKYPRMLQWWEKAVAYQFYHVFALLACGILYTSYPFKTVEWAATFFGVGILCFSGSLYLMTAFALRGWSLKILGPVTPLGGLMFIAGWICLLLAVLKKH